MEGDSTGHGGISIVGVIPDYKYDRDTRTANRFAHGARERGSERGNEREKKARRSRPNRGFTFARVKP